MKQHINNTWFFSQAHPVLSLLTIYVKGDMLFIIPFLLLVAVVGFWSVKLMALMYALFYFVRQAGEMIYWFSHQFSTRTYRPYDFGLSQLDNHAIYILYQLFITLTVVVSGTAVLWVLFFWI